MAAVAPARTAPSARPPGRRPPLRLVPPLRRRRRRSYGDALFATTLTFVLAVGIVGVLLLNTSMQTQADQIQAMRERVAALSLEVQQAQTSLDRDNSPSALSARAVALNMRPAHDVTILRPADLRRFSARARAVTSSHAG